MVIKQIDLTPQGDLIVDQDTLKEAGLMGQAQLIIQSGEIRIVPKPSLDPKLVLDELAGCLGQEAAEEYDFQLKVGGYYEAR
jgi:hypothetical protein